MRDSLALRQRLLTLACMPALALTVACSSSDEGGAAKKAGGKASKENKEIKETRDERKARVAKLHEERKAAAAKADAKGDDPKAADDGEPDAPEPQPDAVSSARPGHNPQAPADPNADPRYLPIPGDPPYVDGYNPEEESCVSGNWCGSEKAARAVQPKGDATPDVMDCPARIVGTHDPSPIKGPEYEGLSDKRQMQGAFNEGRTKKWRADGEDGACCYHWFEYCSGRPLLDGTGSVVAEARSLAGWTDADVTPSLEGLSDEARDQLSRAWLDDALREHASIASFARAAIELMAVGAPPELVEGCMRAGQDETDHARRCFALASIYAGRALGPGPLPPLGPRDRELPMLAVETFLEGCVGETIAALVAERSLGSATDEAVRATLRVIVEDESRHAALAWRTVAWAVQQGGAPVATALLAMIEAPPQIASDGPSAVAKRNRAMLLAHGRLDGASLTQAVDDAWRDIIAPMLRDMLGRTSTARPTETA
jgi:hypothetical protein